MTLLALSGRSQAITKFSTGKISLPGESGPEDPSICLTSTNKRPRGRSVADESFTNGKNNGGSLPKDGVQQHLPLFHPN